MRKERVKHAKRITIDGIKFTSLAEAFYYCKLKRDYIDGEILAIRPQVPFELQPNFKKCSRNGCKFLWERPSDNTNLERFKKVKTCPECNSELLNIREMTYVADFVTVNPDGTGRIIDVKSSAFFQTEIFKLKRRIFEYRYPDVSIEMVFPKVPKGWPFTMKPADELKNPLDHVVITPYEVVEE